MDLPSRLVASFEACEAGLEEFAHGLSADERAALVLQLAARTQRGECPASLLRVLLHLEPTRLQAARAAVGRIQGGAMGGRSALCCLSELRMAVLRHWHVARGGSGGDWAAFGIARAADLQSLDSEAGAQAARALTELGLLLTDVLQPLAPAAQPTRGAEFQQGSPAVASGCDGPSAVLQLLPPLLRAADAAAAVPTGQRDGDATASGLLGPCRWWAAAADGRTPTDAPPSRRVLQRLVAVPWPAPLISAVVAAVDVHASNVTPCTCRR